MEADLPVEDRRELTRLAADLVLGRLRHEEAVRLAVDLLAHGAGGDHVLKLASLPDDPRKFSFREVDQILAEALSGLGLALPNRQEALWITVAFIAQDIIDSRFTADQRQFLFDVMSEIGEADDDLAQMVQLLYGVRPLAADKHVASIDDEIQAHAPSLISEARAKVGTGYSLPRGGS
jgi:hypothetical protein